MAEEKYRKNKLILPENVVDCRSISLLAKDVQIKVMSCKAPYRSGWRSTIPKEPS